MFQIIHQKQFSILYGHKGGSGSLGKPGVEGNRETQSPYMDRC